MSQKTKFYKVATEMSIKLIQKDKSMEEAKITPNAPRQEKDVKKKKPYHLKDIPILIEGWCTGLNNWFVYNRLAITN